MSAPRTFRLTLYFTLAMLSGMIATPRFIGAQDPPSLVYPAHSIVEGKSIGDWLAESWKWKIETPVPVNPNADAAVNCLSEQFAPVIFLPSRISRESPLGVSQRTCVIPAGRPILCGNTSSIAWRSADCASCVACSQSVRQDIDLVSALELEMGGTSIPSTTLFAHRESSTDCFELNLPANAVLGLAAGPRSDAVTEGYVVMLRPLAPGSYTIRSRTVIGPEDNPIADSTTIYDLIVDDTRFHRGDCNDDGKVDLSDAVCTLNWLFSNTPAPGCVAGLNTNGDDAVDLSDAVWLLNFLFAGGPSPVEPFPDCGLGLLEADSDLGCVNLPKTCQP